MSFKRLRILLVVVLKYSSSGNVFIQI